MKKEIKDFVVYLSEKYPFLFNDYDLDNNNLDNLDDYLGPILFHPISIIDFNDIIAIQKIIPELDDWFTSNFEILFTTYGDIAFVDLCSFYKSFSKKKQRKIKYELRQNLPYYIGGGDYKKALDFIEICTYEGKAAKFLAMGKKKSKKRKYSKK